MLSPLTSELTSSHSIGSLKISYFYMFTINTIPVILEKIMGKERSVWVNLEGLRKNLDLILWPMIQSWGAIVNSGSNKHVNSKKLCTVTSLLLTVMLSSCYNGPQRWGFPNNQHQVTSWTWNPQYSNFEGNGAQVNFVWPRPITDLWFYLGGVFWKHHSIKWIQKSTVVLLHFPKIFS
jgi:hypothetical protein